MKISIINKLLLSIELIPVMALLLLALTLLVDSRPLFFLTLVTSILSMVSLIYIMIKTILGSTYIASKFIYLSHIGIFITLLGWLIFFIYGNPFKQLSPEVPFAIFMFGVIAFIPYLHTMIVNKFFIDRTTNTQR